MSKCHLCLEGVNKWPTISLFISLWASVIQICDYGQSYPGQVSLSMLVERNSESVTSLKHIFSPAGLLIHRVKAQLHIIHLYDADRSVTPVVLAFLQSFSSCQLKSPLWTSSYLFSLCNSFSFFLTSVITSPNSADIPAIDQWLASAALRQL